MVCVAAVLASPAHAVTGPDAVAQLNAQRAANGIPGDLVEVPDWTNACALHNEWMRLNSRIEHDETPGPGYTDTGAWAGRSAVLGGGPWPADQNPWENAPIHLMQLLSPKLKRLGASDASGHVCATTWPGYDEPTPAAPALYSYPGDGATGVPAQQNAAERPFVPGDFVGLPMGTTTGPHLYLLSDASGAAQFASAALTGPGGPVEVRTADNLIPQLRPSTPTGGIIIPVRPLDRATVYTASATLVVPDASSESGSRSLTRTWTFKTQLLAPETIIAAAPTVVQFRPGARVPSVLQGRITARSLSPAPIAVTVTASGRPVAQGTIANGGVWDTGLPPGDYSVCGEQGATDSFLAASQVCAKMQVRDPSSYVYRTTIRFTAKLQGRKLTYTASADPAVRRRVTVAAQRGSKSCFKRGASARCHWTTFRTVARLARVSQQRYVTARRSDRAVRIIVTVPATRLGDELYESARLVRIIRRTGSSQR